MEGGWVIFRGLLKLQRAIKYEGVRVGAVNVSMGLPQNRLDIFFGTRKLEQTSIRFMQIGVCADGSCRNDVRSARFERPLESFGLELLGAGGLYKAAATRLGIIGSGAATGGAYGFGSADPEQSLLSNGLGYRLERGAEGALIGGVLGGALKSASANLSFSSTGGTTVDEFMKKGLTREQAEYLAQPYTGRGHHFYPQNAEIHKNPFTGRDFRLNLASVYIESRFNVLKPNGINRGDFYELHYKVDPTFHAAKFPSDIGGVWRGSDLGLEKYGQFGRLWYGSPAPLKVAVGTTASGAVGISYWHINDGH